MLDPIDFWKFHDVLTARESVLLMLNCDPTDYLNYSDDNISNEFRTILGALKKDIRSARIESNINHDYNLNGYSHNEPEIDWDTTTIWVSELRRWLLSKNFKPSFFFSEETSTPNYLNKNHLRYSPKLAATVKVWLAMEDDNLMRGKTPIIAMESYLTNNYKEFELIHKQDSLKNGYKKGDINKGAITSMAKIANWKEKGGAPSTPTSEPIPPSEHIEIIDEFPF